ncbi:MAG: ADP-ribosylation factor-like protein [Candidatus Hodarchaeota archaeon]
MSIRPLKISVIGLPKAGKTSIVHRLKHNTFLQRPKTTIGVSAEIVEIGDLRLVLWDVGGHALHALWNQYRKGTRGIFYVIDIADPKQFSETQDNLEWITSDVTMENIPIAILANKIDIADLSEKKEILSILALKERDGKVKLFQTSAKTGTGVNEAINWIRNHVQKPETPPTDQEQVMG